MRWAFRRRRFVNFLENHDQVANTGLGTRLHQQVDPARWRALTALLLLGPALPLLFQGQEYGSTRPSHTSRITKAIGEGGRVRAPRVPGAVPRNGHAGDAGVVAKAGRRAEFERVRARGRRTRGRQPTTAIASRSLCLRRDDDVLARRHAGRRHRELGAITPRPSRCATSRTTGDRLLIVNLADDHLSPMNDPLFAPPPSGPVDVAWSTEDPSYGGGGAVPFVAADVG